MSGTQHERLKGSLLADKDLESAAVLLCHMGKGDGRCLLLCSQIVEIPREAYRVRSKDIVKYSWEGILTPKFIEKIDKEGLSVISVHSHPSGLDQFSETDDANDKLLFEHIHKLTDDDRLHGSAILLPDGRMNARIVSSRGEFMPAAVRGVGDRLSFMIPVDSADAVVDESGSKVRHAFGKETYHLLRQLKVGVVGCSGTGSVTAEFLARNCVGELLLVDDDRVEKKNLNRILNSTMKDAVNQEHKVTVLKRAIDAMGLQTSVTSHVATTADVDVQYALKSCDVIFGCVDSAEGRFHLECLTASYMIPYFDMGVRLVTDGAKGLQNLLAVAIYSSPDNGGLLGNHAYDMREVVAEGWKRKDPNYYADNVRAGYFPDIEEDQPAVISLNSQAANLSVNDFLARLHGFRIDEDCRYEIQKMDLVKGYYESSKGVARKAKMILKYAGLGDKSILLNNN